ncbi:redoxin domain-containing protein [Ferruginibacter sp. SUN002]|uniref:redoxin domain-containing protein n=1 Tax=Ferruginibacter sp. SUN002 TaxID=2937789 RepID=UPI003D365EDC
MKRLLVVLISLGCFSQLQAQNFKVTLKTPNYKSGIAYLTYHMGKNLNVEDSAAINNKGIAVFTGKRKLPGGIYSIVFPGKNKSVDFFIHKEQIISISSDTTDLLNKTVVTGSKEHILFAQYQKATAAKISLLNKEKVAYSKSTTAADSAMHEKKYLEYNTELNNYREGIIKKYPKSMMTVILNGMRDPKTMDKIPVTHQDSLDNYYYYRAHYWDGITFMDERVIRTPFFLPRFERYYREIIPQAPDSIIKEADYQLLLARTCPEMYKFLLNWLTDEYINPKYMGQDKVFLHLFNKYHSKGLTPWLSEKQHETISRQAYMIMANVIGDPAANLKMVDTAGNLTPLYSVAADFTVVCFWDPTCGHCKEEVPRVDSIYKANWKKHNVKIYGVLSADIKDNIVSDWKKYITEHALGEWVNVYQTKEMKEAEEKAGEWGYHQLFNITTTPTLYLLDKEKRIVGKKLTWDQINDLLQVKMAAQNN